MTSSDHFFLLRRLRKRREEQERLQKEQELLQQANTTSESASIGPINPESVITESTFMQPIDVKPVTTITIEWYQKPWATILFLFLFYPAGIVLMWTQMRWNIAVKVVITGIFAILTIYVLMNPDT